MEIITALNKRMDVAQIKTENLSAHALTEIQRALLLLYKPEEKLIIYGTLAPGKPNHSKVAHITGEWIPATVKGILEEKGWGQG